MTDTQALIGKLRDDNSDTPYTERHEAAAELTRLTTALTEAEAKLAKARDGLSKAAARFNHCVRMIDQGFNSSGTLRLERAMKASQYEIEARACLAELGSAGGENG